MGLPRPCSPVLPGCAPPAHGPPECTCCPTQPLLAVTGQRDLPRLHGKADLPPHSPAPLHFLLVVLGAATTSHVHAPSVPRASVSITHADDPARCGARCEPAICTHTAQQSFPPRGTQSHLPDLPWVLLTPLPARTPYDRAREPTMLGAPPRSSLHFSRPRGSEAWGALGRGSAQHPATSLGLSPC